MITELMNQLFFLVNQKHTAQAVYFNSQTNDLRAISF